MTRNVSIDENNFERCIAVYEVLPWHAVVKLKKLQLAIHLGSIFLCDAFLSGNWLPNAVLSSSKDTFPRFNNHRPSLFSSCLRMKFVKLLNFCFFLLQNGWNVCS
jgi:hypothetical protein